MSMTKPERLKMIDRNLEENDQNLREGRITPAQHKLIAKDGRKAKAEIRQRPR